MKTFTAICELAALVVAGTAAMLAVQSASPAAVAELLLTLGGTAVVAGVFALAVRLAGRPRD